MNAEEFNDEAGWSTLIGRGLPMICSDWLALGVADASSLMPLRHNSRHTKPPTAKDQLTNAQAIADMGASHGAGPAQS